jgi:hypothetical protein
MTMASQLSMKLPLAFWSTGAAVVGALSGEKSAVWGACGINPIAMAHPAAIIGCQNARIPATTLPSPAWGRSSVGINA